VTWLLSLTFFCLCFSLFSLLFKSVCLHMELVGLHK
jgi:hypothetical protein